MDTLLKSPQKNNFNGSLDGSSHLDLAELTISTDEITMLETKASGIKRAKHTSEPPLGRKLCATRHGCQGATDCNYSYANYPG